MLNMVKNHRKMNTNEAAAVPSDDAKAGSVIWRSWEVLMKAATRNSETPWVTKEIRRDFLLPSRSMTRLAAAVPKIPNVLTRPASQLDLYESNPASANN